MSTKDRPAGISPTAVESAPGLWRIDLQRHDLSIPGREVIQTRVEFTPDSPPFTHFHPGATVSLSNWPRTPSKRGNHFSPRWIEVLAGARAKGRPPPANAGVSPPPPRNTPGYGDSGGSTTHKVNGCRSNSFK